MAEPEGDDEQRYFSDPAVVRKIIPPFPLLRLNADVRGKLLGFLVCASRARALRAINDERAEDHRRQTESSKPRPPRAVDISGSPRSLTTVLRGDLPASTAALVATLFHHTAALRLVCRRHARTWTHWRERLDRRSEPLLPPRRATRRRRRDPRAARPDADRAAREPCPRDCGATGAAARGTRRKSWVGRPVVWLCVPTALNLSRTTQPGPRIMVVVACFSRPRQISWRRCSRLVRIRSEDTCTRALDV